MAATSKSVGSTSQPRSRASEMYWCGYLDAGKASFQLSPDGRHAVMQVRAPLKEHLEELRTELSVNGELKEVHSRRSDIRRKLIFTDDKDTRALVEVALAPYNPVPNSRGAKEIVCGPR